MFANEPDVLKYFYDYGEALNIYQLEGKFDNSSREEILAVVMELEKKNQVAYISSALWAITEIGISDYRNHLRNKNTNAPTKAPTKILTDIIVGILVGLMIAYIAYKLGWN